LSGAAVERCGYNVGYREFKIVDMKNLPNKIYLQVDPNNESPDDFSELRGITWSVDRINDSDLEFILNEGIRERELIDFIEWSVKNANKLGRFDTSHDIVEFYMKSIEERT
jgi:hypothetical protein